MRLITIIGLVILILHERGHGHVLHTAAFTDMLQIKLVILILHVIGHDMDMYCSPLLSLTCCEV